MRYLVVAILGLLLFSCSGTEELPEVQFLSPNEAKVVWKGQEFLLEKDKPPPPGFPFLYRFENDGDLDLKISGQWVEFDNPYDIELEWPKIKKTKIYKKRAYSPRLRKATVKKRGSRKR